MHTSLLLLTALAILMLAKDGLSAPKPEFRAEPAPELEALFRNSSGWVGADGDFTVDLGSGRLLWLFGDTFIGKVKDGKRVDCALINNSAAIQRPGTTKPIQFYYAREADGAPKALVTRDDGHGYHWIFDGVNTPKGLFIFLLHVERSEVNPVFPFRSTGMSLAHIANPQDPPDQWKMTKRKLAFCPFTSDGDRYFGAAVMRDGGYAYFYGLDSTRKDKDGNRRHVMVLARAPLDRVGETESWRFYSGGEWQTDSSRCDALCDGMTTEYSVSYVPALRQYAAVHMLGGIGRTVVMRLAPKPEGPWGEPIPLYDCPDRDWHKDVYCYAAKAHPELSAKPNELIITYAANSMSFADLFEDARLYWPRFIRVSFEK